MYFICMYFLNLKTLIAFEELRLNFFCLKCCFSNLQYAYAPAKVLVNTTKTETLQRPLNQALYVLQTYFRISL